MEPVIFGIMPDDKPVEQYTLKNGKLSCEIITYGGAVKSLIVPDKNGNPTDVVLGFDTLDDYLKQDKYMGAIIGRCANRIGGSVFEYDGKIHHLYNNDGKNHLHGGKNGFDKKIWEVKEATENTLKLWSFSSEKEEGYPGGLIMDVKYTLNEDALSITYYAYTRSKTICNMTNHSYFNLSGHDDGCIEDNLIQIMADYYTPTDGESIPTGEIAAVENTPMDLREPIKIGQHADSDFEQLKLAGGYDHNWCINGESGHLRIAARAKSEKTGIVMETYTTQPGIQFYSGNYLDGCPNGKGCAEYKKRSGFCLETQHYPDAVHYENFPSVELKKHLAYYQQTVYRFKNE